MHNDEYDDDTCSLVTCNFNAQAGLGRVVVVRKRGREETRGIYIMYRRKSTEEEGAELIISMRA